MKKINKNVSNPEELNKYLQHTSFITWLILGLVGAILIGFFTWSFLFKMDITLKGTAHINNGAVNLNISNSDLKKIKVGQKVYIQSLEGTIEEIKEDDQPVVSYFALDDGQYDFTIILKQMKPIDFLIG